MTRLLIIPAAGSGSRLGAAQPKLLVPVAGRPMIAHLLDLYAEEVSRVVVVVNPAFRAAVAGFLQHDYPHVLLSIQERPTGMLDAVLAAFERVRDAAADRIWVTWCDQVAIRPQTVARLRAAESRHTAPDLVFPTIRVRAPYIHFCRDAQGRIIRVLQRREGDELPRVGESDAGLFSLSRSAYLEALPVFAAQPQRAGVTGERNFLPFIPWLAAARSVETIQLTEPLESLGINTPADLQRVEAHLAARDSATGPARS